MAAEKSHRWHLTSSDDLVTHFIGAAIEKRMADEIWNQLEDGTLDNAANLTHADQIASVARWLCNL